MKRVLLSSLMVTSILIGKESVNNLKSAIVRSDDHEVATLLKQHTCTAQELHELYGWAEDLIEERKLNYQTTGEAISSVSSSIGLGILAVASVMYLIDDTSRILARKIGITSGQRAAFAGLGCTLFFLYGIKKGGQGPTKRLTKALTIKDLLEEQLVLYRKEQNHE